MPVAYSAVLDVIPRIHGNEPRPTPPTAQPWLVPRGAQDGSQGDGRSFPHGYDKLKHAPTGGGGENGGYDVVLHVGVGRPGAMRIETRARKSDYRLRDQRDLFAPLTGTGPSIGSTARSEAVEYEAKRMNGALTAASSSSSAPSATLQSQAPSTSQLPTTSPMSGSTTSQAAADAAPPHRAASRHDHPDASPRGFPESAYPAEEDFLNEEKPIVNTTALLHHLLQLLPLLSFADGSFARDAPQRQRILNPDQIAYVQPSDDAGLFLCEYIYYASLAESKRADQQAGNRSSRTKVLFMHCPPIGEHLSTAETTHIVREAALYLARSVDKQG